MQTKAARPTAVNADAVAFCPYENGEHIVACGCYELDSSTDPPTRSGRLSLHSTRSLNSLNEICAAEEDVGVLDCLWLPKAAAIALGKQYLAVATAHCTADLYSLRVQAVDDSRPLVTGFTLEDSMPCEDAGHACMGLAWSSSVSAPQLALSGTTGRAYVGQLSPDGLKLVHTWQAHDLECWAVAFGGEDEPHTLFTGGDDATLKIWDMRGGGAAAAGATDSADSAEYDDGAPPPAMTASNRRSHSAGVCCISACPSTPHLVATGSYDERVRLWDARVLRAPICEYDCGGGVWRLKWHPERHGLLLAACMHAGFAVLQVPGLQKQEQQASAEDADLSALTLEVTARYEAHGMGAVGLGYGADWAHRSDVQQAEPSGESSPKLLGATASFYDRQMHLWEYDESSRGQ